MKSDLSLVGFKIIILIIIAVLFIGGIVYFFLLRISPLPKLIPQSPQKAETKIFRASLEAWFEGWDRLYYEFTYPEDEFLISASNDNREIVIKEKQTGRIHTLRISYEGGRGFTPADYWQTENPCPKCRQIANPIAIEGTSNLITFANEEKEWIIFQGPEPSGRVWLFVVELSKPAPLVEQILSTFHFIQSK